MNDGKGAGAPAKKEKKEKKEKAPKEKKSGGGGGLTLAEVAKHTTKGDCWVVVNGDVINGGGFLGEHPGGELAILTFAGKDASEEFNMIHPPDVVGKYAPTASFKIMGKLGQGGGGTKKLVKKVKKGGAGAAAAAAAAPAPVVDKGDLHANHAAWGSYPGATNWRHQGYDHNPGVVLIPFKAYFHAFR